MPPRPPRPPTRDRRQALRDATLRDVSALPSTELALAVGRPRSAEGALFAADARHRFGVHAQAAREVLAGDLRRPGAARRSARRRGPWSPTTPSRWDRSAERSPMTPRSPPTCSNRPVAAIPSASSARSAGWPPCRGRGRGRRRPARELADWQREEIRSRGLDDLLTDVELPLVRILRGHGARGSQARHRASCRDLGARQGRRPDGSNGRSSSWRGRSSRSDRRGSWRRSCSASSASRRKRRGKTGYSTDARVLQAIRDEHPVIPKIERWRELTKLAQTYLDALPALIGADGRIHTTFNQTAATTGRLSSNNPNLQNIPIRTPLGREIRACFVAEPGNLLVSADYSQVELRLLAHIAGEDVLKEIFRRGEDVHTATACRVFGVTPDADRPGHAIEGEDDQLRHRLRTLGLRDGRSSRHPPVGGRRVHPALPRGLPRRRAVHRADDRAGHRARIRLHACSVAAGRSPSCAHAVGRCASRASALPSTW